MHFQIYIPNARGQSPELLVNAGLGDFAAGANFLDAGDGPAGNAIAGAERIRIPGVIVAWPKPGTPQIGYQPDNQTWLPAVPREDLPAGRYWIGFWNDSPPTPKDLARPYPQPGKRFTLGDDREWIVPAARELDATLKLADDGSWRFEPQRRFHAFFLEFGKWFDFFLSAGPNPEFKFSEAVEFLISALRINYRLTVEAASEMRLFTKGNVVAAMAAVMGISAPPEGGGDV